MCIIGICLWYDFGRILLDKQNANNCNCFKSNVICNSRCHGKEPNVTCLNHYWNKDIIQTAFLDLIALDFIILVLFTRSCFGFFIPQLNCSCFGCSFLFSFVHFLFIPLVLVAITFIILKLASLTLIILVFVFLANCNANNFKSPMSSAVQGAMERHPMSGAWTITEYNLNCLLFLFAAVFHALVLF